MAIATRIVHASFSFALLLTVGIATVRGDVIYSGTTDGPWQNGASSNQLAQTFTTGSSAMTLDSVSVWMRNASEDSEFASDGSLSLFLYAANPQPTGSSLLTIVDNQFYGEWSDGWVGATGLNYSLSANTTYAVVFAATAESTISWKYNDSTSIASSITPTPSFSSWHSGDDGATWGSAAPTTGFNMVVSATAVPEPSTYAMALAGLTCGGFSMWRRKRA